MRGLFIHRGLDRYILQQGLVHWEIICCLFCVRYIFACRVVRWEVVWAVTFCGRVWSLGKLSVVCFVCVTFYVRAVRSQGFGPSHSYKPQFFALIYSVGQQLALLIIACGERQARTSRQHSERAGRATRTFLCRVSTACALHSVHVRVRTVTFLSGVGFIQNLSIRFRLHLFNVLRPFYLFTDLVALKFLKC